ncbi:MAG TPA: hypothetical protein VK581_13850, partial [Chthoniobacterales bacterium]|nr:hypothetical protein [Chthoniobacterales bacterium]
METYLESFGDVQVGREEVVTRILDDLIKVSNARQMVIRALETLIRSSRIRVTTSSRPTWTSPKDS